jgi:phage terminase large subunit
MQREYPSFPKEAFDLAIKWAYYEKELSICRSQNRIWKFYYDNRLPVLTAWDLWWAWWWDATAIWFAQIYAKEIRLIDYFEVSWMSMTEIIKSVVNPRYNNYQTHYLPHDVEVTEYSTWVTRLQTAREHLQGEIEVVPKLSISDWISAVRDMFPNCYFHEETCYIWLSMLSQYRRAYDEKTWLFLDRPIERHISKHWSDAFRYLAVKYKNLTETIDFENYRISTSWSL